MEDQRDLFDSKYETTWYEDSLVMGSAVEARLEMRTQALENQVYVEKRKCEAL
jgi:hypothetical protein